MVKYIIYKISIPLFTSFKFLTVHPFLLYHDDVTAINVYY